MRFLADECCDATVVQALRADGHDVLYVAEGNYGIKDREVLEHAYADQRILITEDKDFGELVFRLHLPAQGIIFLRFGADEQEEKMYRLRFLLEHYPERIAKSFIVIEKDKLRIRPL